MREIKFRAWDGKKMQSWEEAKTFCVPHQVLTVRLKEKGKPWRTLGKSEYTVSGDSIELSELSAPKRKV